MHNIKDVIDAAIEIARSAKVSVQIIIGKVVWKIRPDGTMRKIGEV